MRRRAWCAAALLAVTVLGPAGAQAEPDPALVIEGRRSAVTEIVLTEPLQAQGIEATVTGGDDYAGVLIEPADPTRAAPYAVLRLGSMPTALFPANGGTFQPGRYLVRLFTDAPARITLRLQQGDTGRVIRPKQPLSVATRLGRQPLASGRSDAELRLRGAVPARHGAFLLMTVSGQRLEQTYLCATAARACPTLPLRPPSPVPDVNPGVYPPSTSGGYWISYLRGVDQRRDALFGVDGVRAGDGAIRAGVLSYSP